MRLCFFTFLICCSVSSFTQDYSRKSYASIHMYAERLMMRQIVDDVNDVDFNRGVLYYYKEKDLEGDYVHVSGGYSGDYHMAMWKMDNGNDLIGVTSDNCGPICEYQCSFFEFTEFDSVDVGVQIFPLSKMKKHLSKMRSKTLAAFPQIKDDKAQFKFLLPHEQGILRVELSIDANQIEFPLIDLKWDGSEFVIEKKYKEIP